ncbi:MAG: hypothetical protein ACRDKZ_05965 [Actinomycetota bacterium]
MTIDFDRALERALAEGDDWICRRALRLSGEGVAGGAAPPRQDATGGFPGPSGRLSPGATGAALCHLVVVGAGQSPAAVIAADWLEQARTPAAAWLDAPEDVPGGLDDYGGGRVWATAAAACALLAVQRDPGARALRLLATETDQEGHFTGGAYPTFAAAAAYWLAEGPRTEIAEWGLRWAREWSEEWWGPPERITALTFWAAANVPGEHESVEGFIEELTDSSPPTGWPDLDLTLRCLELLRHFQG